MTVGTVDGEDDGAVVGLRVISVVGVNDGEAVGIMLGD
jgi:hypothetical protein